MYGFSIIFLVFSVCNFNMLSVSLQFCNISQFQFLVAMLSFSIVFSVWYLLVISVFNFDVLSVSLQIAISVSNFSQQYNFCAVLSRLFLDFQQNQQESRWNQNGEFELQAFGLIILVSTPWCLLSFGNSQSFD